MQGVNLGSAGADRLDRNHVLQAFAGTSAGEGQMTGYQNVDLLTVITWHQSISFAVYETHRNKGCESGTQPIEPSKRFVRWRERIFVTKQNSSLIIL